MRTKNIISFCLLTVYTLVVAHSIIPHHHHSEFLQTEQHCEFEKPQEHSCCDHDSHEQQTEPISENCCIEDHQHNNHNHAFCSFEGKVVLTKGINLSTLFLPSNELELLEIKQNKQSFPDTYISSGILNPHCRDVQLRGPPQFS